MDWLLIWGWWLSWLCCLRMLCGVWMWRWWCLWLWRKMLWMIFLWCLWMRVVCVEVRMWWSRRGCCARRCENRRRRDIRWNVNVNCLLSVRSCFWNKFFVWNDGWSGWSEWCVMLKCWLWGGRTTRRRRIDADSDSDSWLSENLCWMWMWRDCVWDEWKSLNVRWCGKRCGWSWMWWWCGSWTRSMSAMRRYERSVSGSGKFCFYMCSCLSNLSLEDCLFVMFVKRLMLWWRDINWWWWVCRWRRRRANFLAMKLRVRRRFEF